VKDFLRVKHHLKCLKELLPIDHSVTIIINRAYGLHGLSFGYDNIDVETAEEIVEESGHLRYVQRTVVVSVISGEHRFDIGL
jgi:hypothetical protein